VIINIGGGKMKRNFALPMVKNDIDNYVAKIEKFPLLTAEEEEHLINKFKKENDIEAAQRLVLCNLRFVLKVANEYKKFGFPLKDLIQEGNLGLMKAVKLFEPEKGCKKFISYAVWWIRAQIHEYIMRSWSMVKIGTTQLQKKLFYKFSNIDKDLEEDGTYTKQLAKEYNVTEEKIIELKNRMEQTDLSLDSKIKEDDGSSFLTLVESGYQSPEEEAIDNEKEEIFKKEIKKAIASLNEREQYIIKERYLNENPKTLQELGSELNVTRERIRQIEKRALEKMKKNLPEEIEALVA
jgi:RNA polymerase sigma-32 factor